MLLGSTSDPGAIRLLRQAMSSPNHMIENAAAKGLAELQDKESIPLTIEACKRAPAETASAMAQSLAYFDDPEAQSVVGHYVPTDIARAPGEGAGKEAFELLSSWRNRKPDCRFCSVLRQSAPLSCWADRTLIGDRKSVV